MEEWTVQEKELSDSSIDQQKNYMFRLSLISSWHYPRFSLHKHLFFLPHLILPKKERRIIAKTHTFNSLQISWFENQVSSTTTSGVRGFPLYTTAAIEDVTTTLFTVGVFAHELRTLSVPFRAGSINSAWNEGNGTDKC